MEHIVRQGVILDFYGLPGSGKTTSAHMLADALRGKGYKIIEPIYEINIRYSTKRRIFAKTIATFSFSLTNFRFVYNLFERLPRGCFNSVGEAVGQWVNICFVLHIMTKSQDYDFLIADQGVVQAATSLTLNCTEANTKNIVSRLKEKVRVPIQHIYIQTDINTVLNRLRNRPSGRSRVDKMGNIQEKTIQLQKLEASFKDISSSLECIIMDNNEASDGEKNSLSKMVDSLLFRLISEENKGAAELGDYHGGK